VLLEMATLASGHPIASALSDAQGRFRIDNVPVGKDVPLVVQVGKWRRQVIVPEVLPCQDNPLTAPQMTRLPRNRKEGDLPRVAVTTGVCDPLSCTIAKLGVDRAELGVSGQARRLRQRPGALHQLAGFQVSTTGLFWVSTEAPQA
jgi:hypothetical protein